jgi:polynucleotide 5'-kinase involved in rRNA processing
MSGIINYILGNQSSTSSSSTSSSIQINEQISHQLVSFDEDEKASVNIKEIWHNKKINNDEFNVITIIGDARKGKSTLMNCFVSKLLKMDIECFKS